MANREKIRSSRVCREVTLNLQNSQFLVDFYLTELEGCDVVLRAQWLRTLGSIVWNFESMEMGFTIGNNEVRLVGLGQTTTKQVGSRTVHRALKRSNGKGMLLQIRVMEEERDKEKEFGSGSRGLRNIPLYLGIFGDLHLKGVMTKKFRVTSGLVSMKPYRYPHYQKREIEKLVDDMLKQGIIQVSHSPYSSPVLLVKKHDETWRFCVDYRGLNKIIVRDRFLVPVIKELLDELKEARVFAKLDLSLGYHQI